MTKVWQDHLVLQDSNLLLSTGGFSVTLRQHSLSGDQVTHIPNYTGVAVLSPLSLAASGQQIISNNNIPLFTPEYQDNEWCDPRPSGTLTSNLPFAYSSTAIASGVYFFSYFGQTKYAITPKYIRFIMMTTGNGTTAIAEVGFFSTPSGGGHGVNQMLTKIVSNTGDIPQLTGSEIHDVAGNKTAFNTVVPENTHLWGGVRIQKTAAQQPLIISSQYDLGRGYALLYRGTGTFESGTTFSGIVTTGFANNRDNAGLYCLGLL